MSFFPEIATTATAIRRPTHKKTGRRADHNKIATASTKPFLNLTRVLRSFFPHPLDKKLSDLGDSHYFALSLRPAVSPEGDALVLGEAPITPIDHGSPTLSTVSISLAKDAPRSVGPGAIYRDPHDVKTILQLARSGIVLALLLTVSVAANFHQYYRRPDRIVVDRHNSFRLNN